MPKHKTRNTFYQITWLLAIQLMKFDKFMSYSKRTNFIKNYAKTGAWKLLPGPFMFAKSEAQPLLENETFKAIYLY